MDTQAKKELSQLNEMMMIGYYRSNQEDSIQACSIWLEVWNQLKDYFTESMNSIRDANTIFQWSELPSNWCQDLEQKLGRAGEKDGSFYEKRIKYCQEFLNLLPGTDWLIVHNMKQAIAESYFGLGMVEQGEREFEALVKQFPKYAWAYIAWGDMYYLYRMNESVPLDYERAKEIYNKALEAGVDEKQAVLERLESLEEVKDET